jgi:hypothetical protein
MPLVSKILPKTISKLLLMRSGHFSPSVVTALGLEQGAHGFARAHGTAALANDS